MLRAQSPRKKGSIGMADLNEEAMEVCETCQVMDTVEAVMRMVIQYHR